MSPIPPFETVPANQPWTADVHPSHDDITAPQPFDPADLAGSVLVPKGVDPESEFIFTHPPIKYTAPDIAPDLVFYAPITETKTSIPTPETTPLDEPVNPIIKTTGERPKRTKKLLGVSGALSLILLSGAAPHDTTAFKSEHAFEQSSADIAASLPVPETTVIPIPTPEVATPIPTPTVDPLLLSPTPEPNVIAPVDPNVVVAPPAPEAIPVTPPTPEPPKLVASAPFEFDIVTWNANAKNDTNKVTDGTIQMLERADVVIEQEYKSKFWQALAPPILQCPTGCSNEGYYPVNPVTGHLSTTVMMWDETKLLKIEEGVVEINPHNGNLENAAGGKDINPRQLIHQTYEQIMPPLVEGLKYERDPIRITVYNVHTIASIETGGGANTSNPERRKVYEQQMQIIENEIKAHQAAYPYSQQLYVVAGDWNYDLDRNMARHNDGDQTNDDYWSPVEMFTRLGFICANLSNTAPTNGTHAKSGDRVIDQFWLGGPLAANAQVQDLFYHATTKERGGSYDSDHKAAQLNLKLVNL